MAVNRLSVGVTTLVLCAAVATSLRAQAGMSGTWVATRDTPTSVPVAPSAVFGEQFGLTVGERDVTVARLLRGASVLSVHTLDGSAVRTAIPGRSCMGDGATVSSMNREGATLTYTLSNMVAGVTQTAPGLKFLMRLESADRLVVESTLRTSAQAPPQQVGTLYRRSPDPMPTAYKGLDIKGAAATIANVAWIAGEWQGALGTSTVEERWTPAAGGAMLALSRTTRATTMSAFEFLCIAERAGSLVYTARPNGAEPTDFVLTAVDSVSATFENPAHDFPKKVRYLKRPDGGMDATISGTDKQRPTTFTFSRRPPG